MKIDKFNNCQLNGPRISGQITLKVWLGSWSGLGGLVTTAAAAVS